MTAQEKLLDKLAKIQAHEESARKIGSEAEAQAFAEMLQQLMLKHKIAMSDIQLADLEKEEPIDRHRMDYKAGGIDLKGSRSSWQEDLAGIVAKAHFCRFLVRSGTNRITLVGRESDCTVAEYTFMVLARAILKLSKKAYEQYYYQCAKEGTPHLAKGYRGSFVGSFVGRLGQRFLEERKAAEASSSTALVRVQTADRAVADYLKDQFTTTAERLSGNYRYNRTGFHHGRNAANSMNIHGKAIKTSTNLKLA